DACNSFSAQEGQRLVQTMHRDFSRDAEIVEVNHKNYTDPANELFSQVNNMVCVYNARLRKASPALFGGSDVAATIRRLLDER
ncbi:MAG TPA: hypothetical protein PKO06_24155, partial [Candidatus Ozemobacteraceae bacterium]|nr:hypothetical protein [Candidatus Ozemobacteraceae bacterium]